MKLQKRYKKYANGSDLRDSTELATGIGQAGSFISTMADTLGPADKYGKKSAASNILGQAGQFTAIGAQLGGPWGAAAGAVVGGVMGLVNNRKQKMIADRLKGIEQINQLMTDQNSAAARVASDPSIVKGNLASQYFGSGGEIPTKRKMISVYKGGVEKTPTGENNSFSNNSTNTDIGQFHFAAAKYGFPIDDNKKFQQALYEKAGPEIMAKVAAKYGAAKAGMSNGVFTPDGMLGARDAEILGMLNEKSSIPEIKLKRPTAPGLDLITLQQPNTDYAVQVRGEQNGWYFPTKEQFAAMRDANNISNWHDTSNSNNTGLGSKGNATFDVTESTALENNLSNPIITGALQKKYVRNPNNSSQFISTDNLGLVKKAAGGYIDATNVATEDVTGGKSKALSSTAAEFQGPSHEQGGIQLPNLGAEVEGKETTDGSYVFSDRLGFAKLHKPIAKSIGRIETKAISPERITSLKLLREKENQLKLSQEYTKHMLGLN